MPDHTSYGSSVFCREISASCRMHLSTESHEVETDQQQWQCCKLESWLWILTFGTPKICGIAKVKPAKDWATITLGIYMLIANISSFVHKFFFTSSVAFTCSRVLVWGTETVQVTPLMRRTLASSPKSECASCLQCFDTVGWAARKASGL